jgi:hypothetical protein
MLKPKKYNELHLKELINSGITLSKAETKLIEEYLWSTQTVVSPYQLNSAKGRLAVGLAPSFSK